MLGDLKSARLILLKGMMFLLTGIIAFSIICLLTQSWEVAILMTICIWAFCRFYYFAFYVIKHYVDPDYKFSSLYSFFKYLLRSRKARK